MQSTAKGCDPCLLWYWVQGDPGEWTTWLTNKQLKPYQLRVSQTSLDTCRWINKTHSSTWIYSYTMRGTETAEVEGQWPPSNWPKCSVPRMQMTAQMLVQTFLIYLLPDVWGNILMSLNDVTIICYPSFGGKSTVHVQGNCCDSPAYLLASLPTIFFHFTQTMSCFP